MDISKQCNLVGIEQELCHTLFMRIFVLSLLLCCPVLAQWPDSSESNLAICTSTGEQAITKIIATDDGGCYVSWFDNRSGGYDVYLQRLDTDGNPQWQENGILIADRNYSSTMDYDLDIDSDGNAVVVYRRNVIGGDGIVVTSVSPSGEIRWNQTVQGGGTFVASPVICAVDTFVFVGWITNNDSKFQKLNSSGSLQWKSATVISDPAGGYFLVSDVQPSIDESIILSGVQYVTFSGTKRLKAQRILHDGSFAWLNQVEVMESNSLQFGNFPDFISDGNGGGFFTWYGVSPLQCYATKISAMGFKWFAGEVQVASSLGSTERTNPIAVRDGDEFVVFFRPQDNNQNNDGISAQRFSENGGLLWGNSGVEIQPTSNVPQYGSFAAGMTDEGALLCFDEAPSWGTDVINAVSLNGKGVPNWSSGFVSVASTPSSKSRIAIDTTGDGVLIAWQDERTGTNDIYGQRVNSDGTLGNAESCMADIDGDGFVGVSDLLFIIDAWGACICDADIDSDGIVGVSDLLLIIDAWGACI